MRRLAYPRAISPLASRLTLVASALCIVAAVLALYARSAVLDGDRFAEHAVSALASDELDEEIADRLRDRRDRALTPSS